MSFRLFTHQPATLLRLGLGVGIGLSAATMHPLSPFRAAPMQCQYAVPQQSFNKDSNWAVNPAESVGQKQVRPRRTGLLNAETMRQVSLGSVLGLVAGVGLRAFSKALVVILGMGVVFVEFAASKGYNILPINRIQKYVKRVDLRRAMSEKRPFKMSFGAMMAMAAFANF
ncbi:FUN14 [Penicillium camemberti]|uniref:FUN14 n=1 Tax=Penicillium camemberti (strain FM 013) TaxID=1429867 RepID=A0A0G4PR76_PENC3|nr:FUN14 [Penicillium camemberti]